MPKPEKVTAVAEMKQMFEEADSFFVTDYQGLNVEHVTALRATLRKNGVQYLVAKNTLFKLAANQAGVTGLDRHLAGPTAVAFAKADPVVAAKVLNDSFKERQLPRVKVFVVDKHQYNADDLTRFADLPSREQLLAQVVAAVESPLTELVGSIDGFFRKLIGLVDALADKRKAEG